MNTGLRRLWDHFNRRKVLNIGGRGAVFSDGIGQTHGSRRFGWVHSSPSRYNQGRRCASHLLVGTWLLLMISADVEGEGAVPAIFSLGLGTVTG